MNAPRLAPLSIDEAVQRIRAFCRAGWVIVSSGAGRAGFRFVWPTPPAPRYAPCERRTITLAQVQAAQAAGVIIPCTVSVTAGLFDDATAEGFRARGVL